MDHVEFIEYSRESRPATSSQMEAQNNGLSVTMFGWVTMFHLDGVIQSGNVAFTGGDMDFSADEMRLIRMDVDSYLDNISSKLYFLSIHASPAGLSVFFPSRGVYLFCTREMLEELRDDFSTAYRSLWLQEFDARPEPGKNPATKITWNPPQESHYRLSFGPAALGFVLGFFGMAGVLYYANFIINVFKS